MNTSRLTFEGIRHSYQGKETLRGISLSAEGGEVLCLLGPSGSGKTTLLRIAAGLEAQSHGRVSIDGREVSGPGGFLPPEKRGVGLMFQDFALFPHMTVLQNIRFGLTAHAPHEAESLAGEALARVGLSQQAGKYPHALSGGEQQRVALARALAPRPGVLLMDEPFSGLDSRLKDAVRGDTLAVLKDSGTTAIIVTHDAEEAMRMADRIALLDRGRIVQTGTPDALYRQPKTLFTAGFFSETNLFEGRVSGGAVKTPFGTVMASGLDEGEAVQIAVRLSAIGVASSGEGPVGERPVSGRVVSRRFLGETELLTLAIGGLAGTVRARIRAGTLPVAVDDISITVSPEEILVFEKAS